jgi:hypothetical protein
MVPTLVELVGKIISLLGINAFMHSNQGNVFLVAGGVLTLFIGGMVCLIAEFFLTLRQLALIRLYTGYADNFSDAYKFVGTKKLQLVTSIAGTYLLTGLALGFWSVEIGICAALTSNKALIAFTIPGLIIGLVGLIVSMIVACFPLTLVIPGLAIESETYSKLLAHTFRLGTRNMVRFVWFFVFFSLCLALISSVLNIPSTIASLVELAASYMSAQGGAAPNPNLMSQIFGGVWRSVSSLVLSPMTFFGCGLFYVDLRMRAEGLDITHRLESLQKRPALNA